MEWATRLNEMPSLLCRFVRGQVSMWSAAPLKGRGSANLTCQGSCAGCACGRHHNG